MVLQQAQENDTLGNPGVTHSVTLHSSRGKTEWFTHGYMIKRKKGCSGSFVVFDFGDRGVITGATVFCHWSKTLISSLLSTGLNQEDVSTGMKKC